MVDMTVSFSWNGRQYSYTIHDAVCPNDCEEELLYEQLAITIFLRLNLKNSIFGRTYMLENITFEDIPSDDTSAKPHVVEYKNLEIFI